MKRVVTRPLEGNPGIQVTETESIEITIRPMWRLVIVIIFCIILFALLWIAS